MIRGKKIKEIQMENNNKPNNNFLSAFVLGAIVGAAIVFLLATKKGKNILKAISEEGGENINNILDKINESVELEGESMQDDDESESVKKSAPRQIAIKNGPKTRRFFRGVSRHVN
jgi:gas vesicle protein